MHSQAHAQSFEIRSSSPTDYRLPALDLYGAVHKGLRLGLLELVTRLARIDADECDEAQRAIDDLDGLLYLCERHAEHEDRHLHRAVEQRRAGGSADQSRDHEQQRQEVLALRALALATTSADRAERPRLWRALQLRYSRFVGENLVHMAQEEEGMQRQLEQLYDIAELGAIQRALLAGIGPDEMLAWTRLMLRAATGTERTLMLERMRAMLPAAALEELSAASVS
jgi:hypothetical protein